jgi:hypothetical protein
MSKKYVCIAKVGSEKFVKYHVHNLVNFTSFLDAKWEDWRFFNVFDNHSKRQLANFTKTNRPTSKIL